MTKILGSILFFIAFCVTSWAQTSKLYTSDYDLSSSLVTCLFQDHEGIIWIGTEDGLNRFDGNEFTAYQHIPGDRNSLAHNYVRVINEDSYGHLLVGTYSGVQEFLREKNLFTWTPYDSEMLPLRSIVRDILPRIGGDILISGEDFYTVRYRGPEDMVPSDPPLGLPTRQTSQLLEDREHNLWVIKGTEGAFKLDYDYMLNHAYTFDTLPTSICEVPGMGVFVSTGEGGLEVFDPDHDQFIKCAIQGLNNIYISKIKYLDDGKIYLCTSDAGLLTWQPGDKKCETVLLGNLPFDCLKSNVTDVMKDNAGNLWVCVSGRGVVMMPVTANNFKNIGNRGIGRNPIDDASVTSLSVTKDNRLWIGTNSDGIYSINLKDFSTRHYPKTNSDNGVKSQVTCLFEDSKGRMWFGTYSNGLARIDRESGKCTYYEKGKAVSSLSEDMDGAILVATTSNGIFRFIPETGAIEVLSNLTDLVGRHVECLLKPDERTIYIGSNRGAFGIVRSKGDQPPVQNQYLSKQIVHCVHKSGNTVYFGTSAGLVTLDERTGEISSYTSRSGLPSNVIFGICGEDEHGIWLSTSNGLSRFDPDTRSFDNFFAGDGLQGNEFVRNAVCSGANGDLYFGGSNGITYFTPSEINKPTNQWRTRCRVTQEGRNYFHIDLSPFEYNAPEGIRFEFSLDGKDWDLLPSKDRHIELNSLGTGKHHLEARIVDRDVRSEATEVEFRVKPAWWFSTVAILIYLLLAFHITMFAVRYYKLRVQAREQLEQLKNLMGMSQETNTPIAKALMEVEDPELISPDDRLMQRVMRVINENISNPELTVDFISQEVGISRVHLYRKLKEITNQTSKEFVRNIRLAKAAEMLKQKKHSIAELSEAVGYNSPSAFSTAFKELYGVSPSEYSKKKDED